MHVGVIQKRQAVHLSPDLSEVISQEVMRMTNLKKGNNDDCYCRGTRKYCHYCYKHYCNGYQYLHHTEI